MTGPLRFALVAPVLGVFSGSALAAPPNISSNNSCIAHAPEAAARSGLAVDIVLRVMRVESAGKRRAVSHKGAMGCMQIMPGTWTYLTGRYRLGADPYDARLNMVGGALYLAELVQKFGLPGAFAAYNAGPGRYSRYARRGVPLPAETVAYVAQLDGRRAIKPAKAGIDRPAVARWQEASLFIVRGADPAAAALPAASAPPPMPADDPQNGTARKQEIQRSSTATPALFPLAGRAEPADH